MSNFLTFDGTWSSTTTYSVGNVVFFNGSSYVSLINGNQGNTPPSPSNWAVLAAQGPTGPQGATGPTGATGLQGPAGISQAFVTSTNTLSLPAGNFAVKVRVEVDLHAGALSSDQPALITLNVSGPSGSFISSNVTGTIPMGSSDVVVEVTGQGALVLSSTANITVSVGTSAFSITIRSIQFEALQVGGITQQ